MAKTRQTRQLEDVDHNAGPDDDLCCSFLTEASLSEDDAVELGRLFGALSDPVRLRLLSLVASQVEVCSCDLEGPLDRSQPTISHHTKVLAEVGLIVGEKRGRWMWWRADPTRLAAVRTALGG
jgi:ArsR family transcriptional regulator